MGWTFSFSTEWEKEEGKEEEEEEEEGEEEEIEEERRRWCHGMGRPTASCA